MEKESLKDKLLWKLAKRLIDRSPICPTCKGHGYILNQTHLDDITTVDEWPPCTTCESYGHYPLSWFTKWVIKQIPD